jgi:ABC-type Fe3+ transport system permease subunit
MKTGRFIGWILLALALIFIGHEALNALEGEGYRLIALGELWFRLDQAMGTGSLNATQAFIQRYVWAWLWEGVIQNILIAPAWVGFGIPGTFLSWTCRNRGRPTGLRRWGI